MNQTFHILRKDMRFLRFEIAGMVVLSALMAVAMRGAYIGELLEIAPLFVVARLIHAEAIPGDRQFWLTRPYRPLSLLAAKLIFIFCFICVPIGIAQAAMAMVLGFPLAREIPGLIWTQVLLFFVAGLPVVALATVTEGLIAFISTVLVLVVIAFLGGTSLPTMLPRHYSRVPVTVEWIGTAVFGAVVSCIAGIVVWWQYRDRRTLFSRLFGVITFYVAMAFYLWLPAAGPLRIETWFSKHARLADSVKVSIDPSRRVIAATYVNGRDPAYRNLRLPLPIVVSGLADGVEARIDSLGVSFEWPGTTWSPERGPGSTPRGTSDGETVLDGLVMMDPRLFAARKNMPATIRGTAYITLFGEPQQRTISLKKGPVNVQDGLQCFSDEFANEVVQMICRSFYRWPSRLVYAEGNGQQTDFSNSMISYSPLPARLDLNPLEVRWTEPIKSDMATIVTKKPLVHFRREFELSGVRLAELEKLPHPPKLPGMP